MKCAENQVSRQRRLHGNVGRLVVADFPDQDDVRRLTQHGADDSGEVEADLVLHLDLIDAGAEDIDWGDEETTIYTKFSEFGHMLKFLESKGLEPKSSSLQYIPATTKELPEDQQDEVLKLVEVLEADDDVQNVYHNLA